MSDFQTRFKAFITRSASPYFTAATKLAGIVLWGCWIWENPAGTLLVLLGPWLALGAIAALAAPLKEKFKGSRG